MPDPILYYVITVNRIIDEANVRFRPGHVYRVKPEIYELIKGRGVATASPYYG